MPRRGENIYKRRDGRWEGRYIKGRNEKGKAQYGSIYGKKYCEVRERLLILKNQYIVKKCSPVNFNGTLSEWLGYWLEGWQKNRIKPSTYASYRNKLECHIPLQLGGMILTKVTRENIQEWIDLLTEKGLAASSIKSIYRIITASLQTAVNNHCLLKNPCRNIVLPKDIKKSNKALSLFEQKRLEQQALSKPGNEGILIALYTGMRIGEISALTWKDIDFEKNIINVHQTLQRIPSYQDRGKKTQIIIELPKSASSRRQIPFSGHFKALLRSWKDMSTCEYVVSCKGHYAEPRVISYRFQQAATQSGLTDVTFHSLRHTYTTRCMEQSIDISTVSHLLGHASVKMTLDTYAGSTMEQRDYAMNLLDRLLPLKEGCVSREPAQFTKHSELFDFLKKYFENYMYTA